MVNLGGQRLEGHKHCAMLALTVASGGFTICQP